MVTQPLGPGKTKWLMTSFIWIRRGGRCGAARLGLKENDEPALSAGEPAETKAWLLSPPLQNGSAGAPVYSNQIFTVSPWSSTSTRARGPAAFRSFQTRCISKWRPWSKWIFSPGQALIMISTRDTGRVIFTFS